jgi:tRNA(adenine34) deaminase
MNPTLPERESALRLGRVGIMTRPEELMRQVIEASRDTLLTGDVPVAAAVVDVSGTLVSLATNTKERDSDPTGHAEILVLRQAGAFLRSSNLSGYTLVVTLEPCVMCAGAITQARISRLIFGAWDPKAGAAGSKHDLVRDRTLPHRVDEVVGGVLEDECAALLRDFFRDK